MKMYSNKRPRIESKSKYFFDLLSNTDFTNAQDIFFEMVNIAVDTRKYYKEIYSNYHSATEGDFESIKTLENLANHFDALYFDAIESNKSKSKIEEYFSDARMASGLYQGFVSVTVYDVMEAAYEVLMSTDPNRLEFLYKSK